MSSSVVQASTTARTVTVSGVDATTAAELCRCSVHHSPTTCLGSAVAGYGVYAAKAAQLSPYVIPLGSTARVGGTASGEDTTLAAQLGLSVVLSSSTTTVSPYVIPLGSTARVGGTGFGEDTTSAAQLSPYVIPLGSTARVGGTTSG